MIFLCIYMKNITKKLGFKFRKSRPNRQVAEKKKKRNKSYIHIQGTYIHIQRNDEITIYSSHCTRLVLFKQSPAVFYLIGVRCFLLF